MDTLYLITKLNNIEKYIDYTIINLININTNQVSKWFEQEIYLKVVLRNVKIIKINDLN